jgi:ribosomal protein L30/L7E
MKDWDLLVEDVKEIKGMVKETNHEVKEQAITLARNTESLIHHSARTSANEERIKQVERYVMGILMAFLSACLYYFLRR